jgi:hypothetical protein
LLGIRLLLGQRAEFDTETSEAMSQHLDKLVQHLGQHSQHFVFSFFLIDALLLVLGSQILLAWFIFVSRTLVIKDNMFFLKSKVTS